MFVTKHYRLISKLIDTSKKLRMLQFPPNPSKSSHRNSREKSQNPDDCVGAGVKQLGHGLRVGISSSVISSITHCNMKAEFKL